MNTSEIIKLTQFSKGAGCGCKIAPAVLSEILEESKLQQHFPSLLVGNQANDDAAVWAIDAENALISTTDFFMPIVDDAFDFGQIAAANAVSDVFAMGGKPIMALAILGWPIDKLPLQEAKKMMNGAQSICTQLGIPLAGGHSIDSQEPIFGLAVTGMAPLSHIKRNNTAQVGDVLFLTKPIGVGIYATAMKRGLLEAEHEVELMQQLKQVNSLGALLGAMPEVTAMTDVTGFGLAGHLLEMVANTHHSVALYYEKVPKLKGLAPYLAQRVTPDATFRNWNGYSSKIHFDSDVNVMEAFSLLPDPQTNGGLLIAVHPTGVEALKSILLQNGYDAFLEPIGAIIEAKDKALIVRK